MIECSSNTLKVHELWVADISELILPVIALNSSKEITSIGYNTQSNPFTFIELDVDKANTFTQNYEDNTKVFKQTLDINIDPEGDDYSTLFEEVKRWCGVVCIIVTEDGKAILQGADFVFNGSWRLIPTLTTTTVVRDIRSISEQGGWSIRIEGLARNYAPNVIDYENIVN